MLIYLLIFFEIILLIFTYYCFQKSLFSPSFVFFSGFLIASICAASFQGRWGEILQWNSFLVFFIGLFTFFIVSVCIHISYRKIKSDKKNQSSLNLIESIEISKIIYFIFAIFHVMAIFFLIKRVKETAAMYGVYGSWSECIEKYRYLIMFTTNDIAKISKIGSYSILITRTSASFWGVIVIYNFLCEKKKVSFLALLNLILCILCDFLGGSRTGTVVILISCIVIFYIIWSKRNVNRKKLPFKYVLKIGIILILIVFSFQTLGGIIGRNVEVNFVEYFAKYIGAPIKNFDIFMQKDHILPDIWGKETFAYFINWIGNKTGDANLIYNLDLPFIKLNDFNMGNVYTTFYMFVYDFSTIGVIWCTAIMAAISQIFYELSIENKKTKIFTIIMYSMIVPQLALSFFSNKFYEAFATYTFMQKIVIILILILVVLRYRVSFKRGKIIIRKATILV